LVCVFDLRFAERGPAKLFTVKQTAYHHFLGEKSGHGAKQGQENTAIDCPFVLARIPAHAFNLIVPDTPTVFHNLLKNRWVGVTGNFANCCNGEKGPGRSL
jgi:hypothetical protein